MPAKKPASKSRRRKQGLKAAPLPLAPAFDWKRPLLQALWLGLAFALGVAAGMRQGWVEGHHSMRGQDQRWQVRELEGGKIVKHGLFRENFPGSRILKIEGDFFMDQRHGTWTEYHRNGKIKSRSLYGSGRLLAPPENWDEEGRKIVKKEPF